MWGVRWGKVAQTAIIPDFPRSRRVVTNVGNFSFDNYNWLVNLRRHNQISTKRFVHASLTALVTNNKIEW